MILLSSLLFSGLLLAQAFPVPAKNAGSPSPAPSPLAKHLASRSKKPKIAPTPSLHLTIVNATCLPEIFFTTAGTNRPVEYPRFPQGRWIESGPRTNPVIRFLAGSPGQPYSVDRQLNFPAICRQFLVLTGDLSRHGPMEKLPGLITTETPATPGITNWPANFQIRSYPVELATKDPFHYRVLNAMPGKTLTLTLPAREGKPRRVLGILTPGGSLLLTGQPSCIDWIAEIDGREIPLSVHQEGASGNCLISFFLKQGEPAFVRVFENP